MFLLHSTLRILSTAATAVEWPIAGQHHYSRHQRNQSRVRVAPSTGRRHGPRSSAAWSSCQCPFAPTLRSRGASKRPKRPRPWSTPEEVAPDDAATTIAPTSPRPFPRKVVLSWSSSHVNELYIYSCGRARCARRPSLRRGGQFFIR
jgi:hypothetical protein